MTVRLAIELQSLLSKTKHFKELARNTEVRSQNNKVYLNTLASES